MTRKPKRKPVELDPRELTRDGPVMPEERVRRAKLFMALCKPAPPDPSEFEDPDYGL